MEIFGNWCRISKREIGVDWFHTSTNNPPRQKITTSRKDIIARKINCKAPSMMALSRNMRNA
jgi:hypothetical protein